MTFRESILNAVNHQVSDYTPYNIELTSGLAAKMCERYGCEDTDRYIGNHMLRIKYKQNEKRDDGTEIDIFGVTWTKSKEGGDVGIIVDHPMKEPTFKGYRFPEIRKEFADDICNQLKAKSEGLYRMFGLTMCYFERAWSLRGMEAALLDMVAEPVFTQKLYNRILDHHLELLDCVLDRDFEAVHIGDDWGQQQGMIMGPQMWRKFIKPGMAKMFDKIKSAGKQICLHCCGDVREIFPDLIDMGVDIYNTLQPEIYDLKEMKRQYGKDITFYGGISTQQFLPFATVEEVKVKTRQVRDILGENGGYIISPTHAVTADIPVENVMAMVEAAKE